MFMLIVGVPVWCWQRWDAADWRWEREYERQQRLKAEAAKQAALEAERAAMQQRLQLLAQRTAAEQASAGDATAEDETMVPAPDAVKAEGPNGVPLLQPASAHLR